MTTTAEAKAVCLCGEDAVPGLGPDGRVECEGCSEYREQKTRERLAVRASTAEMPLALQGISLEDCPSGAPREAAYQWVAGEVQGLCLTGEPGVGKTYLAAAAAWARLQNAPVRWVSAARLMAQLRSGFNSKAKAKADSILTGDGAIVLDDLDKVNPTDYGREVMFNAIDARVEAGTPLLVTTNESMEGLGDKLGDPVKSRVAGYCRVVMLKGRDRRLD